jgi:hypothetical protein
MTQLVFPSLSIEFLITEALNYNIHIAHTKARSRDLLLPLTLKCAIGEVKRRRRRRALKTK